MKQEKVRRAYRNGRLHMCAIMCVRAYVCAHDWQVHLLSVCSLAQPFSDDFATVASVGAEQKAIANTTDCGHLWVSSLEVTHLHTHTRRGESS